MLPFILKPKELLTKVLPRRYYVLMVQMPVSLYQFTVTANRISWGKRAGRTQNILHINFHTLGMCMFRLQCLHCGHGPGYHHS